jgi:hypothetical protein
MELSVDRVQFAEKPVFSLKDTPRLTQKKKKKKKKKKNIKKKLG